MSRVKVTVLSDASAAPLVLAVLPAFAAAAGISAEDARRLGTVVERLVRFTLDNAYPDDDFGEIEVTLEADADLVHVTVHDWGLPLTSAGGDFGPLPEPLAALAPDARNVQLLNLGSDGKRLTADVPVRSSAAIDTRGGTTSRLPRGARERARRDGRRDRGEGGYAAGRRGDRPAPLRELPPELRACRLLPAAVLDGCARVG